MSEESKRVSDLIKPVLSETLSAQAYALLLSVPGFGWVFGLPVIRQVTQFIIGRITDTMVQETAVGLSLLWIQVEMAYEIDSAEKARAKLKSMLDNPSLYSEIEQEKIDEYFDETTVNLIQLGLKRL